MAPKRIDISRRLFVWLTLSAFVSPLGVAGGGFVYTNRVQVQSEQRWENVQRKSDARWCAYFSKLVADYPPPQTPREKLTKESLANNYALFGCGKP